jgi:flagellar hook protein FlgE
VPVQVGGNATLTFGPTGVIAAGDQAAAVITGTPAYGGGAAAGNFTINLAQMTQYATGSQLTGVAQDGRSSGNVKDFRFDSDGSLYAVLDSGTESLVARLPVATFRNNDGLERIGGNLFAASDMAGERTLNIAGEGISGAIEGSSLERSTVDLAAQFVDLVLFQRGYQASSQTLSAANELIQATIQLIR